MGEWISVKTELPEDRVDVLVAYHWKRGGNKYAFDVECLEDGVWIYRGAICTDTITHWQPLPPPPELFWQCKNCGENERPRCPKCTREDGLLVTDELVRG